MSVVTLPLGQTLTLSPAITTAGGPGPSPGSEFNWTTSNAGVAGFPGTPVQATATGPNPTLFAVGVGACNVTLTVGSATAVLAVTVAADPAVNISRIDVAFK